MSMTQTTPRTSNVSLQALAAEDAAITKDELILAKRKEDLRAKVASLAQSFTARTEKAFPVKASNTNGTHKAKPTKQAHKKGGKVAIKYRHGENTWTGRGRAPRWLAAAEKQGAKRESFLVTA